MEHGPVQPTPITLTARQLAWLKELGVSKPWLPVVATDSPPPEMVSARQAVPDVTPDKRSDAIREASPVPVIEPARGPIPGNPPAAPVVENNATDLQALEAQVRQCELCGLCRERTHAVPGQGVTQPSIMVVGEAPGEQEDRQGLPFVGRSGQLLDNMLAAISHHRDTNVFITNVVKCRPPGNRNPDAQEIASCSPYLMRQIAMIQPRVILAMGRFAAQTLLKKEASMQVLRGGLHFLDVGDRQIPVVATYHPAYLLRRPVEKASAWQDLKRVEALLSSGKA